MIARLVSVIGLVLTALLAPMTASAGESAPACEFPAARRVVVVSGLKGYYEDLRVFLRRVNLTDDAGAWTGGDAHLVQMGDFFGLGPSLDEGPRYLMGLEKQALAAGGRVHVLHGKADNMILRGEVSRLNRGPDKTLYLKFATDGSEAARQRLLERLLKDLDSYFEGRPADQEQARQSYIAHFNQQVRPGAAEFLETLAPGTELGDWLRSRNVVIRIGDAIFSNAGISEKYAARSLPDINKQFRDELREGRLWLAPRIDQQSPVYWSELSRKREIDVMKRVEWIAWKTGAAAQVIGHSPIVGVVQRGRVFHVDSLFGSPGNMPLQALEILNGRYFAIQGLETVPLTAPEPAPAAEPERPEILPDPMPDDPKIAPKPPN